MTFDLYNAPIDPKSIVSVLDPHPTMMQSFSFLGYSMPEKSGRHTYIHTYIHTDIHTDAADHSIVAHFIGATIMMFATLLSIMLGISK